MQSRHPEIDFSQAVYAGFDAPYVGRCSVHGEIAKRYREWLSAAGCPKCGRVEWRRQVVADAAEAFMQWAVTDDRFDYSAAEYAGADKPIKVKCTKCGGEVFPTPANLQAGHECNRCANRVSAGEDEIAKVFSGFDVVRHNRSILGGLELDVWVPELRLGVEYHGVYWHTVDKVGDAHRRKWERATAAGIRLVQVFEDEWLEKPQIVEACLRHKSGQSLRVDARKCEIAELPPAQRVAFFRSNHLQGDAIAAEAWGLWHEGRLVAAMSFGRRWGKTWELLRFASTAAVVGGASKLLTAFRRKYPAETVNSYCDLRWGDGGVYKALGFELAGVTQPDYWWTIPGKVARVSRYVTQVKKLAAHPILGKVWRPGMSEADTCRAAGWLKIEGVGHQKWVLQGT